MLLRLASLHPRKYCKMHFVQRVDKTGTGAMTANKRIMSESQCLHRRTQVTQCSRCVASHSSYTVPRGGTKGVLKEEVELDVEISFLVKPIRIQWDERKFPIYLPSRPLPQWTTKKNVHFIPKVSPHESLKLLPSL